MELFLYWYIYSFFGFVIETTYTSILTGKLQDRGFLSIPIIPIYGFGAMIVIMFLEPYINNYLLLFLLSILLTTILEYITSYVMEKLFHMRWWDYSNNKFNIKGRVCLRNSILFGILSLILVGYIHPYIIILVNKISTLILYQLSFVLLVITLIDSFNSVKQSTKYRKTSISIGRLKIRKENKEIKIKELYEYINNLNSRIYKRYPVLKKKLLISLDEIKNSINNKN